MVLQRLGGGRALVSPWEEEGVMGKCRGRRDIGEGRHQSASVHLSTLKRSKETPRFKRTMICDGFTLNTKRSIGRDCSDVDCQKPHIVRNLGGCLGLGNNSKQIEVDDLTLCLEYSIHFSMREILQRKITRK